jgi:hypothetical protein
MCIRDRLKGGLYSAESMQAAANASPSQTLLGQLGMLTKSPQFSQGIGNIAEWLGGSNTPSGAAGYGISPSAWGGYYGQQVT